MKNGTRPEIFFYTHWRGSDTLDIAMRAIAKRQRWDDPAYLARIVFCELIKGATDGETGFGIWTDRCDYEHDDVVIDCDTQEVYQRHPETGRITDRISFQQIANLLETRRTPS
jgi:hypothetical protein